jgi:site-specific DNA recombinase
MQSNRVDAWCAAHGMEVVGTAIDVDVSGAVSPFDRESLGAWLTDSPPKPYDFIVSFHLSRVSRSALDTMNLVRWLDRRGRNLATVDDGLNTSTTFGKTVITIIAALAEAELEATSIRLLENKDVKRKKGFVVQGSGGWGYSSVEQVIDGVTGMRLVQNPKTSVHVEEAITRVTKHEHVSRICEDFTRRGIALPSDGWKPRKRESIGTVWHSSTLTRALRSWTLCGYQVHSTVDDKGRRVPYIVRDERGNPVMVTDDPIITRVKFDRLQKALDKAGTPHSKRRQGSALSGVVGCSVCGRMRVTANTGKRRSLKCTTPGCTGGSILERVVWDRLVEEIRGWYPDDVEMYEMVSVASRQESADRVQALEARETELKESMRLNAMDRSRWESDGLGDVYQQIQAEHREALAAVRAELAEVGTAPVDEFAKEMLGVTLYGEIERLRTEGVATVDAEFLLSFAAGLSVSVGPALPRGEDPGRRVDVVASV